MGKRGEKEGGKKEKTITHGHFRRERGKEEGRKKKGKKKIYNSHLRSTPSREFARPSVGGGEREIGRKGKKKEEERNELPGTFTRHTSLNELSIYRYEKGGGEAKGNSSLLQISSLLYHLTPDGEEREGKESRERKEKGERRKAYLGVLLGHPSRGGTSRKVREGKEEKGKEKKGEKGTIANRLNFTEQEPGHSPDVPSRKEKERERGRGGKDKSPSRRLVPATLQHSTK